MLGFKGGSCLVFVITSGFRCIEGMFLIFYCIFGYIVHSDRAPIRMHWDEPPRPW